MSEKPILFNTEMVLAILDGKKNQTRRIIKQQPVSRIDTIRNIHDSDLWFGVDESTKTRSENIKCPYGKPGAELYVKESWRSALQLDRFNATEIKEQAEASGWIEPPFGPLWYPADGSYRQWGDSDNVSTEIAGFGGPGRLRQSRFMPRWASRIQLKIKDIRVERVQNISEEDALLEGVTPELVPPGGDNYRHGFETLWNSINEKRGFGWDADPWVWVIEFERITH